MKTMQKITAIILFCAIVLAIALIAASGCENPVHALLLRDVAAKGPNIVIKQDGVEILSGDSTYDFGSLKLGETLSVQFTIENSGEGTLSLSGDSPVTLSGTDPVEFDITSMPETTIEAGASSGFTVDFTPVSLSEKTATVSIQSNDPDTETYQISLIGNAPGPEINIKLGTDDIPCGTGYYSFGTVNSGSFSDEIVFTIENKGIDTLILNGNPLVSIIGTDVDMFSVTSAPSSNIASGGGSSTFSMRFGHEGFCSKTATVSITNNDRDENPYTFTIQGTAYLGDVRITNASQYSRDSSLVWTGTGYGVAWNDYRNSNDDIYFARISNEGVKQGNDIRITIGNSSQGPSLVWAGDEYGLAWYDNRDGNHEVYFTRIDSDGVKIGSDIRITNATDTSGNPSLIWTGSEYGVAWADYRDGNYEIYFTRIDSNGVKIGNDIRITNASGSSNQPSLVWTGSEYGVAWYDARDGNSEIYFARLNSAGVKQGSDVRITNDNNGSLAPSLAWTGSEYGVAWYDNRDGNNEIYFARISSIGAKQGSDVRISNSSSSSYFASIVFNGKVYGIAWQDSGNFFTKVSTSGVNLTSNIHINDPYGGQCSLVWNGMDYALTWNDGRDSGSDLEIYFACFDENGNKK